mmetsp:Transcript_14927/g.58495  ORF Transcript_14927/g.58495 Transcript_14927/m.58495 type:complete len:251 (+) Transcript_14927:1417-2169(+)
MACSQASSGRQLVDCNGDWVRRNAVGQLVAKEVVEVDQHVLEYALVAHVRPHNAAVLVHDHSVLHCILDWELPNSWRKVVIHVVQNWHLASHIEVNKPPLPLVDAPRLPFDCLQLRCEERRRVEDVILAQEAHHPPCVGVDDNGAKASLDAMIDHDLESREHVLDRGNEDSVVKLVTHDRELVAENGNHLSPMVRLYLLEAYMLEASASFVQPHLLRRFKLLHQLPHSLLGPRSQLQKLCPFHLHLLPLR